MSVFSELVLSGQDARVTLCCRESCTVITFDSHQCEQMERQVSEVARMRTSLRKTKALSNKASVTLKDREKDKAGVNKKHQQLEASRRDAARTKRMTELMRQLGTVLRQVQHLTCYRARERREVPKL